jgi:penicillin amidase
MIDGVERLEPLGRAEWPGLAAPVRISWDAHLIPSISAETASDAAYAMGVVHAHLRLSQMEMFRRASQGRLSEMAGPFAIDIDEAIRAIDLGRASAEIEASLPDPTREWIEAYVRGINAYREQLTARPSDARALGLAFDEPWTVRDVLTFGRLASVDVNWGRWFTLAQVSDEKGYSDFVVRLWRFGDAALPSFQSGGPHDLHMLEAIGRTGSNAVVVSGARSRSGGALVASDPHLGLFQPNIWCVVGYRTPDTSVVGLTIPGLPFVVVGRNERIAWTGTNMQSSSSALYRLPEEWEPVSTRRERIGVRLWPDATRDIRESAFGPVITDASLLAPLDNGDVALRWRGHDPSDEPTAFLRVSLADGWIGFRESFTTYAVGGQNMLFGDADGNIGQVMAIEAVPAAAASARAGVVSAGDEAFAWSAGVTSDRLPASYNPADGFLVSANNVPTPTAPALVPQGNANDRVSRMRALLDGDDDITLDDLAALQRDTFSAASLATAKRILTLADDPEVSVRVQRLLTDLGEWNGWYDRDSRGALVYQAVLSRLIDELYSERYGEGIRRTIRSGPYVHEFVLEDLARDSARPALRAALRAASVFVKPGQTWGDVHELRLAHPLGAVPVVGSGYVFDRLRYEGSTTVVAKAAHAVADAEHTVRFGANARLLVDMGTLDVNRVVLLGGQDGWIGSDRMLDMVPLWTGEHFVPLPLSEDGQENRALVRIELTPANGVGRASSDD